MEFPIAITSGHVLLKQLQCSRILLPLARLVWDYPIKELFCTPSEQKQASCCGGGHKSSSVGQCSRKQRSFGLLVAELGKQNQLFFIGMAL